MPAFLIVQQPGRIGETVDAALCDPDALGYPNRQSDTPVRVQLLSGKALRLDGEVREIVSALGSNGSATFLINASTKSLRNRERRIALAKASGLLKELATCLQPLRQQSEEPELATEGLGLLCNWLADERDRLTEGARRHGPQ